VKEFIDFFFQPYYASSTLDVLLELIAVSFGIASVIFAKNENILVFPTGIISTILYIIICYKFILYGDMLINIYYTLMSVYGWYVWSFKVSGMNIVITISKKDDVAKSVFIFLSTIVIISSIYFYFDRMRNVTDYLDTFTSAIFFTAMWLMANKKIEHWIFWIIGNLISIPLYFVKGLGFSSIQFTIFLILAIIGYMEWKKNLIK
jgi:nicotinamide mononucleotide transporter|tara:strand:+ start:3326 stop:3940 length:615 start_codon:yes stop_codon:yes gene_type:complete